MATGRNNLGVTLSNADGFMKQWYIKGKNLDSLMYEADPFLMRLKRLPATTTTAGDEIIVPIRVGRSPTASKTFSEAQNQASNRTGERKRWLMPVDEDYGVIRVENKAILASRNDRGAFVRLLRDEADSAMENMHQRLCTALFSSKANLAGTVRSRAGSTITLSNAVQATAFDIGDTIEFRTTAGAERAGNPYIITKVNRATGLLTFNQAVNSAVAANDEVYKRGDYGVDAITGLDLWVPDTLAAITTLHGMDRSLDPLRLGGHRLQMGATDRFDDSIRKLCSQINQLTGKNPTIVVVNPLVENLIAIEQRPQIRFDDSSGKGAAEMIGAGVGGLSIKTAKGKVELVTSSFCPVNKYYVLNEHDLALYYMSDQGEDAIYFVKDGDGTIFKRAHNASGIEARLERYSQFAMQAPGLHGKILLHSSKIPTFN